MYSEETARSSGTKSFSGEELTEMQKKMLSDLGDEIASAQEYIDFKRQSTDEVDKQFFCSMAEDEYNHAYFLKERLEEYGVEIPEEYSKELEDLKHHVSLFHY